MSKRKSVKKEYNIEKSPFYSSSIKLRASLEELTASDNEVVVLARKRYFKQDEYTKIITNHDFNLLAYDSLSSTAKTILRYILFFCLEYNDPIFRLKAKNISILIHKDTSIIHKAIRELIANNDIAKTGTKEVYWINHNRYYKGNYVIDKFLKKNEI